ncbi:MAG: hypothetical protein WAL70_13085 [Aeromicrobium sp.]
MDALIGLFWLLAAMLGGSGDAPECLLLGGLDAARAKAFVADDEERLGDVYSDERAARADIEVLRSYRERGLRLEGMLLVRNSCRVTARSRWSVTLDVVDRLGPTSVRTKDERRQDLPRDQPTRRFVELVRVGDGWRVAAVESGEGRLER